MPTHYLLLGLWLIVVGSLVGLSISLAQNKFRLLNGALANILVFTLGIALILTVETMHNPLLYQIVYWIVAAITTAILIFYASLGLLLLWNAVIVWQHESHSLANNLTLILGLVLVSIPLIKLCTRYFLSPTFFNLYKHIVIPIIGYVVFWFLAFVTSFLITRLYRPRFNQDYIIILGAGLLHGDQVSPLLAARINVALNFAQKQFQKTGYFPLIICSGGQGTDETIPEGRAMKNYVLHQGIAPQNVLSEEQSRTTYENMLFSKKILQAKHINLQNGIFATSDYHTFRAAGYARYVGLNITGIGAKTSHFFVPNAFLREYLALLNNHKKFHIICLSLILMGSLFDVWAVLTN